VLRVRFHSAARAEAEAAARWYEEREPRLGADLVTEVERAVDEVAESPETWPRCPEDSRARRLVLSRFPFSVIYVVTSERQVVIVAVAHTKRRPGYWSERLPGRK
jgi:plasmid stabilization system protein ParE